MKVSFLFLFLSISLQISAQVKMKAGDSATTMEMDSLKTWADSVRVCKEMDIRLEAAEKLEEGLLAFLEKENSFENRLDSLPSISKMYPQDSTFRILTWQLYVDTDEYKYYGIIQTKDKKGKSKIFPLKDFSARMRYPEKMELSPDNWYGALYYNIKSFKSDKKKMYLLFGYDAYSFYERRKLLDVLYFNENGEPVFGSPILNHITVVKDRPDIENKYHRFILQYSAEASSSMNYDEEMEMVVFDHFIQVGSRFPDIPYVNVPDGSYEGLKLEKGEWVHHLKLFHETMDEAPREQPLFDKRKDRGMFGGDE